MTELSEEVNIQEAQDSFQSLAIAEDVGDVSDPEKKTENQKVDIILKPIANAPIMKKKKWSVDGDKPISWIIRFMGKYIKLEPQEKLFVYVNQTFAPSPDQTVRNLYDCYSTEGKLVLHYCKTQAWG